MSRPDPFGDPVARRLQQKVAQLALLTRQGRALRARKALMERLFGPVDAPSDDGRAFLLLLAEMAEFGATDIAPSDREETARAAKRALLNRLLLAWGGDQATMARLREAQARIEEELND